MVRCDGGVVVLWCYGVMVRYDGEMVRFAIKL